MAVFIDPETRKHVLTADEAGKLLDIEPSNIRHWGRRGELTKIVESPRRVYYFLHEIKKRNKEATATKKRRGGRPRKGTQDG
jgi:hypothetical protein